MEKIIVIGASSGIGRQIALQLLSRGCMVGVAGRRSELLEQIAASYPQSCFVAAMDVCSHHSTGQLDELIARMGGIDTLIYSSGVGWQNRALDPALELRTVQTNVEGFVRIIDHAYNHFRHNSGGHIAAISSIAGTKALGSAAAYSASKRFQNHYLDALAQLSHSEHSRVDITDIRPGFVRTELLAGNPYPMQMNPTKTAQKIVKAIERKQRIATIDWRYKILVSIWSMIPRWIWERLTIG